MNKLKGIGFLLLIIIMCHVLMVVVGIVVISGLWLPILATLAAVWYASWCIKLTETKTEPKE